MEKITEDKNELPFKGPLEEREETFGKIKIPLISPDKIVKETPVDSLRLSEQTDEVLENIKETEGMLDELKNKYSINIPKSDCVIGRGRNNSKCIFFVTDRIDGICLKDISDLIGVDGKIGGKLENLCKNLLKYLINKVNDNKPFLWDIFKKDNYMLENKKSGLIYLIDMEGYIARPGTRNYYSYLLNGLTHLVDLIYEIERELSSGRKRNKIRAEFKEAINKISPLYKNFNADQKNTFGLLKVRSNFF